MSFYLASESVKCFSDLITVRDFLHGYSIDEGQVRRNTGETYTRVDMTTNIIQSYTTRYIMDDRDC